MQDNITLDELLTEAAGGEPAANDTDTDTDADGEPTVDDDSDNGDTDADANTDTDTPADATDGKPETKPDAKPAQPQKKPNPIKEVRDKLNLEQSTRKKIESTMERFTNGDYNFKLKDYRDENGKIDYDRLIEAMDEVDNETKAKSNNITPEIQRELDRIEKEKVEIRKQQLEISMNKALTNMQIEMGLKGAEINQFFADALSQKRNPYSWLAAGGDIQDLYYIIYRDKMIKAQIDKAVAEERAKWDTPNRRPSPAANPAKKPSVPASDADDRISLSDLLNAAAKR